MEGVTAIPAVQGKDARVTVSIPIGESPAGRGCHKGGTPRPGVWKGGHAAELAWVAERMIRASAEAIFSCSCSGVRL